MKTVSDVLFVGSWFAFLAIAFPLSWWAFAHPFQLAQWAVRSVLGEDADALRHATHLRTLADPHEDCVGGRVRRMGWTFILQPLRLLGASGSISERAAYIEFLLANDSEDGLVGGEEAIQAWQRYRRAIRRAAGTSLVVLILLLVFGLVATILAVKS